MSRWFWFAFPCWRTMCASLPGSLLPVCLWRNAVLILWSFSNWGVCLLLLNLKSSLHIWTQVPGTCAALAYPPAQLRWCPFIPWPLCSLQWSMWGSCLPDRCLAPSICRAGHTPHTSTLFPTEGGPAIGAPGSWGLGPWAASVEAPHACSFRTHVDLSQFQARLVDLVLRLPVPEGQGHLSADWRHHSLCPLAVQPGVTGHTSGSPECSAGRFLCLGVPPTLGGRLPGS